MNSKQWQIFLDFKEKFKAQVLQWQKKYPELAQLQIQAAKLAKTPEYPLETPVVYNRSLDDITQADEIKLIVIGDNPGKDEQLFKNNRYLVGQAGKIADGFFKRNPVLDIDFRKNVIILNKTPIHSAKTNQLNTIVKSGGPEIKDFMEETQIWMAEQTSLLHAALTQAAAETPGAYIPELWLVGYSELKEKGLFSLYKNTLQNTYFKSADGKAAWNKVYIFQHFSMNRFTIDLDSFVKKNKREGLPLMENIHALGTMHKGEFYSV